MKLVTVFRHLDVSSSLQKYCEGRILEISRFLLKDGTGAIHFSKSQHLFCVDIAINTRERFFKASASHADIYTAVDEVVGKLEKQFLKTRKTLKSHKRPELSRQGRLKRLNGQFEVSTRFKKAA